MLPKILASFSRCFAIFSLSALRRTSASRFFSSFSRIFLISALAISKSSVAVAACARRKSTLTLPPSSSSALLQESITSLYSLSLSPTAARLEKTLSLMALHRFLCSSPSCVSYSINLSALSYFFLARASSPALYRSFPSVFFASAASSFSASSIEYASFAFSSSTSSTVYTSVEPLDTTPRSRLTSASEPKPNSGAMVISAFSPLFIVITALSKPSITSSLSVLNVSPPSGLRSNGSLAPLRTHASYTMVTVASELGLLYPPSASTKIFFQTFSFVSFTDSTFRQDTSLSSTTTSALLFSVTLSAYRGHGSGLSVIFATSPFFIVFSATFMPSHGAQYTSNSAGAISRVTRPSACVTEYSTSTSSFSPGLLYPSPSVRSFLITPPSPVMSLTLFHENSSTSKMSVASGGIFGGEPCLPYAYSLLQVNIAFSPLSMVQMPWSQPLITWPSPTLNTNGSPRSRLLSKGEPSSKVPT
mmetsp:Transcript_28424/g.92831  ORF Transcript_28424/g.92831 Transcript_28424/m.92831 type:complete len:475 (-) Transcript_28424:154-1578(-)